MEPENFYRRVLETAGACFPQYPCGRFGGKGIVICAGGLTHISNAFVCMKFLRGFTDLPIELFHAGSREMPEKVSRMLEREFAPIAVRDITDPALRKRYPFLQISNFRGVQIKPFAILHSSFEEILYIDADNIPLQSPEPLFTSEEYLCGGAIFWPDLDRTKGTTEELFRVFGMGSSSLKSDFEFESGQIVLDKRRCWKALLTVCLANSDTSHFRDYCYRHTNGDKDTFRLAFQFAEQSYHLVTRPSVPVGSLFHLIPILNSGFTIKIPYKSGSFYATGMLQFDFQGCPLFLHKTVMEWDIYLQLNNLGQVEEPNGRGRPLKLLKDVEDAGHLYLKDFKQRYLGAFGNNYNMRLRAMAARLIIRVLDRIHPGNSGKPS